MRISGGTVKGRRIGFRKAFLKEKDGGDLRPTSSKVREAIFDIIRSKISGASFLDLYAGTGGVGLEALSRGAGRVVFVESDRVRVRMIKELLAGFKFDDRAAVVGAKVDQFVRREAEKEQKYDIIFLDPPYGSGELMEILPVIGEGRILEEGGLVIAEHFFKKELPKVIDGLHRVKEYRYGDTKLTLYRCNDTTEGHSRA